MKFEYVLFDLDGTLTDPAIGITNSIMYALKKFGIEVCDRSELYKFIGPPLWDSFEEHYGLSKDESNKAVEYYREYYRDKGIFENFVYDGIENLLKELKRNDRTLIVATSKPEVFAKQILDHFDLSKYFTFIAGSNLDGTRIKKSEVIRYAFHNCDIKNYSNSVMIGDRKHDIIGAKELGISSIGVLFGYGGKEELEEAGANFIVNEVGEIKEIILV